MYQRECEKVSMRKRLLTYDPNDRQNLARSGQGGKILQATEKSMLESSEQKKAWNI